jgi:hypothetical protein
MEMEQDISATIGGDMMAFSRITEEDLLLAIHGPAPAIPGQGKIMDKTDPFRIIGTQGYHQPGGGPCLSAYLEKTLGDARPHLDMGPRPEDQVVPDHIGLHRQPLAIVQAMADNLQTGWQELPLIVGDNPAIKGPAIPERGDQPPGINKGKFLKIGYADSGPVSIGQIDMGNRKGPGDKGIVCRIKLSFHPVRPQPIQVMLDNPAVDETAGMENHSGPQQFNGFAHLGGLGKTMERSKQGDGIKKAMAAGSMAHQISPRKPFQPHHFFPPDK